MGEGEGKEGDSSTEDGGVQRGGNELMRERITLRRANSEQQRQCDNLIWASSSLLLLLRPTARLTDSSSLNGGGGPVVNLLHPLWGMGWVVCFSVYGGSLQNQHVDYRGAFLFFFSLTQKLSI